MKITHSKYFQFIEVEAIEYSQYEQIIDYLYSQIANRIISSNFRKNLQKGFFVLMNEAYANKIYAILANPPPTLAPSTDATKEAKKMTKASKETKS